MKIVFMGSPEFALASLQATLNFAKKRGGEVSAVFTQPDRPSGRGQVLTPVAVAQKARKLGIPVYQPKSLRKGDTAQEAIGILKKINPDVIVVVAYGLILPMEVLGIPQKNCLNVHASLLPKYRGAAPIQWALADGETKSGVTIMRMDEGLDTGDIISQREFAILPDQKADDLFKVLSQLGGELLEETLGPWVDGMIKPIPQPKTGVSLARLLEKSDALIDWKKSAQEIYNRFRGFYPWPGCQTKLKGEVVKIHAMKLVPGKTSGVAKPGEIVSLQDGICVSCGDGQQVILTELQLAGKKRLLAGEFLKGNEIQLGETL